MMRCSLVVKISINGSPFHYSRLVASYQPCYNINNNHNPDLYTDRALKMVKMTSLPHGFVDPCVQSPLQLDLPFILQENYIRTRKMVTPTEPQHYLGKVWLKSTTELEAVSATAASTIPVVIFAWAENVELVIPTHDLVAASGRRRPLAQPPSSYNQESIFSAANGALADLKQQSIPPDEQKDGLVSSVSSVVANAAGMLTNVPFIGEGASMVKGVANGVTKLARFFGFSRPPVFTDAHYVKQFPMSSIALTQGNETVSKLTFDPKQSVSIDPAINAMGSEDELAIKMFTNKEAMVSTVLWSSSDAVDDELFWANVTPTLVREETVTQGIRFAALPMAIAAMPFKFWSGSLVYRFQFVSSAYHTGRIRITFEPNGSNYNSDNYNTTYSQVVDLSSGTDVSFVVPWAQTIPYKRLPTQLYTNVFVPPSGVKNYDPEVCNGIIYLTVLNPLISPDALKDVTINVFVKGGDDLTFAAPNDTELFEKLSVFPPAAVAASGKGNSTNAPDQLTMLFGEVENDYELNNKASIYFGEHATTFRTLLKRYQHCGIRCTNSENVNNALEELAVEGFAYPPAFGLAVVNDTNKGGYSSISATQGFNFGPNSLINHLGVCFLGYRGSIRWKFFPSDFGHSPDYIKLTRHVMPTISNVEDYYLNRSYVIGGSSTAPYLTGLFSKYVETTWKGAYFQPVTDGQPACEIEIPWYSNLRFTSTDFMTNGTYNDSTYDPINRQGWQLEIRTSENSENDNAVMVVDTFAATGEDFTFNFFLGAAPLYSYDLSYTPVYP